MAKRKCFPLTLLFLILSTSSLFTNGKSTPCSHNCSKKLKLIPPRLRPISISNESVPITLFEGPRTVRGALMDLRYWRSYCHSCLACDPTQNCEVIERNVKPSENTLDAILKHRKCPVGPTCAPNSSDCLGGGLFHCQGDPVLDRWAPETIFRYRGMFKYSALGDSCVQDWECSVTEVDYPLDMKGDGTRGIWAQTISTEGVGFILEDSKTTLFTGANGKSHIVPKVPMPPGRKIIAHCIKHSPRVVCMIDPKSPEHGPFIVRLNDDGYGSFQNFLVHAPTMSKMSERPVKVDVGAVANHEQLQLIINELLYEQLQAQLNDLNILASLHSTNTLLHDSLLSLTQSNPQLLPDIIKVSGTTMWTDPSSPHVCPCQSTRPVSSFCHMGLFWERGVPRWQESSDVCNPVISSNGSGSIELQLFKEYGYDETLLPTIEFRTSITDQESRSTSHSSSDDLFVGPNNSQYWMWESLQEFISSVKGFVLWGGIGLSWIQFMSFFFRCLNYTGGTH